ncbi:hypothetical protein MRB53_031149 [Persea americana]|uniref:Uncharacterized protein n=1 Tax=Persea americana TaxID=3435 RepID=A0ACC2KN96_PERAE|nr:hypothetical protein MRB53_031149 [Persea americana]
MWPFFLLPSNFSGVHFHFDFVPSTAAVMASSQCCENPPTLSSTCGLGTVEQLGGLKTYITGSSHSKLAILLVSDVYGYEAPNLRKLADKIAAAGFYVVVPDFLYGDPYVPDDPQKPVQVWIKAHGTDKGYEDAKSVIADLKSKGIAAIGAAGFCWGAKVVVALAKIGEIQAAVLCHPSFVTVDDIKEVKSPISILGAEVDKLSPPELVKQFEEILSGKTEVGSFVKIFPGVAHGWTVRYSVDDAGAVQKAEEAHEDMLAWFTKHINVADMASSQCCENPPALISACGVGTVEQLGGLKTYVTGSPDSKFVTLLISDVFGYEAPNLRKLADKFAASGFYVVVPDFLYGDPYVPDDPQKPVHDWINSHGTDKGYEDAKSVIADLKTKGFAAIGAGGFCWGAKVVVELAKAGEIQAAVLCHPSRVTVDDIKEVKSPISILGAEVDRASPPELVKQFEEILSGKTEVGSFVKIFPGVAHGWTVRYSVDDTDAVTKAEEAHEDMLVWFTKHIK